MIREVWTIFQSFHDGLISNLHKKQDSIMLTVDIRYLAELMKNNDKKFHCELMNCRVFEFQFWGDEDSKTNELDKINQLELEIVRADIKGDTVVVKCLSDEVVGGDLHIEATNIRVFDQRNQEITSEKILEMSREYWRKEQDQSKNKKEGK
ncbi:hypothetical protein LCL95_16130 [Bacillus timonensis]|nr:hypothetical protein [Bacillus timonensis]